jgi:hypothetical protein
MGHMTESDRAQVERAELGHARGDRMLGTRSARGPALFLAIALPILAAGIYLTIAGIDTWWQALVLGVIVMTTIGLIIAVSPTRRG